MHEKPIIKKATVVSFERRTDRKIWYIIQVVPSCRQCPYFVARRYEDFCYLSAYLDVPTSKIKDRSSLLISPRKRLKELNRFLQTLFRQPAAVTNMSPVVDFFATASTAVTTTTDSAFTMTNDDDNEDYFGPPIHISSPVPEDDAETEETEHHQRLELPIPPSSPLLLPPPIPTPSSTTTSCSSNNSSLSLFALWKPSRKSSSSSLSSLCSQVAKVFPSISTPPCAFPPRRGSRTSNAIVESSVSSSSVSSHNEAANCNSNNSDSNNALKCKIVYDIENIVIVQLARHITTTTTTLQEFKQRILQKLGAQVPQLNDRHFDLVYDDARSSSASSILRQPATERAVVISKQAHFEHLMNTKWAHLSKITLRCVVRSNKK